MFDGGPKNREKWAAVKSKNLFAGICLMVLIISEILLIVANGQKSAALAKLRSAQQEITVLQSQLYEATNSASAAMNAELARLRADNLDVPRLRRDIQQLQDDNAKLSQALAQSRDAARQQQEQLAEVESENEQAAEDQQAQDQEVAQIAAKQRTACIANLRLIYLAKQAWALDKKKTDNDVPTEQDLLPYLKGEVFPVCPAGGTYTIGPVGELPTCSIPGHVLPPQ